MWTTYWWGINDEDSDLWGEEFFTELKDADAIEHKKYAQAIFPNEKLTCYGMVSEEAADMMGLDTY
jgi:ribulose kinase